MLLIYLRRFYVAFVFMRLHSAADGCCHTDLAMHQTFGKFNFQTNAMDIGGTFDCYNRQRGDSTLQFISFLFVVLSKYVYFFG